LPHPFPHKVAGQEVITRACAPSNFCELQRKACETIGQGKLDDCDTCYGDLCNGAIGKFTSMAGILIIAGKKYIFNNFLNINIKNNCFFQWFSPFLACKQSWSELDMMKWQSDDWGKKNVNNLKYSYSAHFPRIFISIVQFKNIHKFLSFYLILFLAVYS
jgi:hypothetical protein